VNQESRELVNNDKKHSIHAYIDETGDRGASPQSSPIFGMAAIILDEQGAVATRAAVKQLRADFNVPDGSVMSWKRP